MKTSLKVAISLTAVWVLVFLCIQSVSASVLVYGSEYNYSAVVLPNNSYVHQGENISQGYYYDLSGIYGFSGELANWNDDYFDSGRTFPDHIIDLTHPRNTYIDPSVFPVGKYYQWDGGSSKEDFKYSFGSNNAYVFAVVKQQNFDINNTPTVQTVTKTKYITILQGGSSIQVPVTYTEEVTVEQTPNTIVTAPTQTIVVPPTTQTPEVTQTVNSNVPPAIVTQKSPSGMYLPIISLILMGVFFGIAAHKRL